MSDLFANDFTEILNTLSQNQDLLDKVNILITNEPITGKAIQGEDRLIKFRDIFKDLVSNKISLDEAYQKTKIELPRSTSAHSQNNRVFASGWSERLVRIQLSRFYNQAVMEKLIDEGEELCFVPHSTAEKSNSPCSIHLAGKTSDLKTLYNRLIKSYRNDDWSDRQPKIPDHPHCTHVVTRK